MFILMSLLNSFSEKNLGGGVGGMVVFGGGVLVNVYKHLRGGSKKIEPEFFQWH